MNRYFDNDYDSQDAGATWPEVLTPRDVQAYLGIGQRTFYQLVQSRELPAFRIRKQWRVRLKDLEQFCDT